MIASHGMTVKRQLIIVWRCFEYAWIIVLVILEYGSYCVVMNTSVTPVLLLKLPLSWGAINEINSVTGNERHDCIVNQDQG